MGLRDGRRAGVDDHVPGRCRHQKGIAGGQCDRSIAAGANGDANRLENPVTEIEHTRLREHRPLSDRESDRGTDTKKAARHGVSQKSSVPMRFCIRPRRGEFSGDSQ